MFTVLYWCFESTIEFPTAYGSNQTTHFKTGSAYAEMEQSDGNPQNVLLQSTPPPTHVFASPSRKISRFRVPATNFTRVLEKSEKHPFGAQYSV